MLLDQRLPPTPDRSASIRDNDVTNDMRDFLNRLGSTERSAPPNRRSPKIYKITGGPSSALDGRWVNQPEIGANTHASLQITPGVGFPEGMEFPRFEVAGTPRAKRADVYSIVRNLWLVSNRAKAAFEKCDKGAFAFIQATLQSTGGVVLELDYWLCDVVRLVDALDAERSGLKLDRTGDRPQTLSALAGGEASFRAADLDGIHFFRLATEPGTICCDETGRGAIRAASPKLRGIDCSRWGYADG